MGMFPRSAFGQTVFLVAALLLINQIVSYITVSFYVVKPTIEQVNLILSKQVKTVFIEWEEGVEVSKEASDKFFEITGIEVMTQRQAMSEGLAETREYSMLSRSMSKELNGSARVRISQTDPLVYWVEAPQAPGYWVRVPLTGLQENNLKFLTFYLSSIGFLSVLGGAFGVGLAFGLQKIASNYVCGFIILMDKSIHIGDILLVGEHYGVVTLIRSRYTVLRKLDGVEVIIPNETLISENIVNHSFSDRKARVSIEVQISYKSSVDKAFEIILKAAKSEKRVLKDPEPNVFLTGFGDNGIDILLSFYILDPEEGSLSLKSDINQKIWKQFQAEGIDIPYPYRTVEIINNTRV